jgi:N-acetylglucosaminyldiphosphoundecaprenol N-acetyl-beta-D-mannosaminyltransferase
VKREKIFDVKILDITYKEIIQNIINDIKNNCKKTIIAINPEKLLLAKKNQSFKAFLNQVDYPIPDGIGVVLASKFKKGNIKTRITGIDLVESLCDKSRDIGARIFLYGGKPGVAKTVKEKLEIKYPKIKIVGALDGYNNDNDLVIDNINKSKADILFVALGTPKQEIWIRDNKDKLNVNIFQGVGGSFDVISGNIKRAPKLIQKLGLEWAYRLIKQPTRILRQFNILVFLFILIFSKYGTGDRNGY